MNEEPKGDSTIVAETATRTTTNVLDQAGEVANNAGAQSLEGALPPTIEAVTPATENVVAGAQAAGEPLPQDGTQAPSIETVTPPPTDISQTQEAKPLNAAAPLGTPDTAALSATHVDRQNQIANNAAQPEKKGHPLKPWTWFNKSYENQNQAPAQAQAAQGGVGVTPATAASPEPPPTIPLGANPELLNGQTPPVPNVTPEASAAEATATKTLGTDVNGQPITEAHLAEASTGMPGMPVPGAEIEEQAQGQHTAPDTKDFTLKNEMEDDDKNPVPELPTAKDAGTLTDPLAVKPDETHEASDTLTYQPPANLEEPDAADSSLPDIEAPVDATSGHVDATTPHADAPIVGQTNIDTVSEAAATVGTGTSTDSSSPTEILEPGDTPIENVQHPLPPISEEHPDEKWRVSAESTLNPTTNADVDSALKAGGADTLGGTGSTNPNETTPPLTSPDGQDIVAHASDIANSAGAPELTGTLPPAIETTSSEATAPTAENQSHTADAETSNQTVEPTPTITPVVESTPPSNIGGITPDVTPTVQTPEQITAAQSGTGIGIVGQEQATNETAAPEATTESVIQTSGDYPGETATPRIPEPQQPDSVSPINPDVTIQQDSPPSTSEGEETNTDETSGTGSPPTPLATAA